MKKINSILKLVGSIAVLLICFFRNQIFKPEGEAIKNTLTVLTVVSIFVFGRLIFSSITELFENHNSTNDIKAVDGILKKWTKEELYFFLEKEDMIDVVVKYENITYNIGSEADIRSPRGGFGKDYVYEKGYYIEEKKYDSIEAFKADFESLYKSDIVLITYIGIDDIPVTI